MATLKPEKLLDLDALTERAHVRISGTEYELRSPEEFSIVDYHAFAARWRRFEELINVNAAAPTDESVEKAQAILKDICRSLLFADDAVLDRLTAGQQMKIAMFFMTLQRSQEAPIAGSAAEPGPVAVQPEVQASAPAEGTTTPTGVS